MKWRMLREKEVYPVMMRWHATCRFFMMEIMAEIMNFLFAEFLTQHCIVSKD